MSALENDDASIVGAVRAGDHQRFALLVRRYNRALFRVVRGIVRAEVDAEDVLQEAHLAAYSRTRATLRADLQEARWPSLHQFDGPRCERMTNLVMAGVSPLAKPATAS